MSFGSIYAGAALLAALFAPGSAQATCTTFTLGNGATVTCDFATDPETGDAIPIEMPILAPGSTGVSLTISDLVLRSDLDGDGEIVGGRLIVDGSPAISLGGDAEVVLQDVEILDIAGDGPHQDPTVGLGGPADPTNNIDFVISQVQVKKAMMADRAINAITNYLGVVSFVPSVTSTPLDLTPLPLRLDIVGPTIGSNIVVLDGSHILSMGTSAIEAAAGTGAYVRLTDGSSIETLRRDNLGISLDPAAPGGLRVFLDDSSIVTNDHGAAAISAPGADSALGVQLVNGSQIVTHGDDAPAILGPGDFSVFVLELRGNAEAPSLITRGDRSAGVMLEGPGLSSIIIDVAAAGDTPEGAGLQTHGDDSPLFGIVLAENSSVNFSGISSSFATHGDNAPILLLDNGPGSDALALLLDASLTTQGDNSWAVVQSSSQNSSISNLVAIDVAISTLGDGSGGIFFEGADDTSSATTFIAEADISTGGDDAPAFATVGADEQLGNTSSQTITIDESRFSTLGDRSPGLRISLLNDGSAGEQTLTAVEIDTAGAWSPGMDFVGVVDNDSASSTSMSDIDIATLGANAPAIRMGGFAGGNSVFSLDAANLMLSTEGDGSGGFVIADTTGIDGSTMVSSFDMVTIETLGDDAPGFLHGTSDASGLPDNMNSSRAHAIENLTIATQGARSPGLAIYGYGDGNALSDTLVFLETLGVTTQGEDSTAVLVDIFGSDLDTSIVDGVFLDFTVETQGDRSHGVILGDGQGANGGIMDSSVSLFAGTMSIATGGEDSHGLIVEPIGLGATDSAFTITLENISVETAGDRSHGIVLGGGLGTEQPGNGTVNELRATGLTATTSGADAHALVISQGATLTMDNGNLGATTDDTTVVNGLIDSFDGFAATGPGGRAIHNEGILYGEVSFGPGIVGNISNNGLIESETGAGGTAVAYGDTDDIFELQPLGRVIGTVEAGDGEDSFILGGTGSGSFDHSLIGTQYMDFEVFVKEDASTWTLTGPDSAAPFLPGTVTGGTLIVDPVLSNFDLMVESGGRLEGNGGVGDLTVGGTFAPGGSIGSFSVAGDLVFQPSSIFEVEIAANGDADHVSVGGSTTLAGTIAINGIDYPTGYPVAQDYTVITSQGAISGEFEQVTDNLPDIDATVTVLQPNGPNPGEVIVGYDPADDESAKGIYPATLYAGANAGRLFGEVLTGRGRIAGSGVGSQTASVGSQLASAAPSLAAADPARSGDSGLALWFAGLGQHIDQDSRNGRKGYDQEGYGGALGVETAFPLGDGSGLVGAGLGYSWNDIDSGDASADLDAIQAGLYAGYRLGRFSLAAAGSYSWTETDTRRPIFFTDGGGVTAKGDTDGYVLTGSLGAAYDVIAEEGGLRVTPFAGVDVAHVHQDGFNEKGAGILNLSVDDESDTQVWSTLGVALGFEHRGEGMTIRPELSLAWEHRFGGDAQVESSIPAAAANFETEGVSQDHDRAVLGAGLGIDFGGNVSAILRYDGAFGAHSTAHRGTAGVTIRF